MAVFPPYPSAQATRLMENVRGKILGVSLPTAQAELFSVERDFCDKTNVWQEDIEVPIVKDIMTYQIAPAEKGAIIRLLNLFHSNDVDRKMVAMSKMSVPGVITLRYPPSEDALWVATVAKVPVDPTDIQDMPIIDDWIVGKYYDTFEHGMLGRLHLSVSKPYYSKEAGGFHWRFYNKGRSEARVEVLHANNWGAQAWNYPQSFGIVRPQRGV